MKPYGPVAVTINTPFQIGIDNSAQVIQVHNNTGLSLRLYFGAAAPASPTYPSQWHATIDPGAHPVLPVNGSQYFDGTLSFYPYSVQGAQTQQPGVIAASSFVSVEAYFANEQAPQSVYSPVFQQGAAQQRVIALPPSANASPPAGLYYDQATATPQDMAIYSVPLGANVTNTPSGGTSYINAYLHGFGAKFKATMADTQAELEFTLDVVHTTSGGIVLTGPFTIYTDAVSGASHVAAPTTVYGDRIGFFPAAPIVYTLRISAGVSAGDRIVLQWTRRSTLGNWRLFPNAIFSVDVTNQSPAASYGVSNGQNLYLATSAINPQTY